MTEDATRDDARSQDGRDDLQQEQMEPLQPEPDPAASSRRGAPAAPGPVRTLSPWSLLLGGAVLAALVLGQWVWVIAILGLAFLITVHEFGHFIAAKSFGMRTAFIDRRKRPFAKWPHQPDLLLPSMTALADVMV